VDALIKRFIKLKSRDTVDIILAIMFVVLLVYALWPLLSHKPSPIPVFVGKHHVPDTLATPAIIVAPKVTLWTEMLLNDYGMRVYYDSANRVSPLARPATPGTADVAGRLGLAMTAVLALLVSRRAVGAELDRNRTKILTAIRRWVRRKKTPEQVAKEIEDILASVYPLPADLHGLLEQILDEGRDLCEGRDRATKHWNKNTNRLRESLLESLDLC
jgi:hypothetical protein